MRVVIFTAYYEMGGLAIRLQQEGVEVVLAVVDDLRKLNSGRIVEFEGEKEETRKRRLAILDGMVKKVSADEALQKILRMRDRRDLVVLFDMNFLFRYAEPLRDLGIAGNFPSEWDRMFEHDRALAKSFVARYYPGIRDIPTVSFHNVEDAESFLQKTDRIWVLKGAGDAPTVVPKSEDVEGARRELLEALREDRKDFEEGGEISLEARIEHPVEVTPERVYLDGKLVYETICIEGKHIGAFDVGPQVGCATDIVFDTRSWKGIRRWVQEIAFPDIVDELAARSPGIFIWDASLLIDAKSGDVYFGEFCPNRFGYNALYTEIELFTGGSAAMWLEGLLAGEMPVGRGYGASARIFQMNRTDSGYFAEEAISVSSEEGVWWFGVKRKDGRLLVADSGERSLSALDVGIVTGWGKEAEEAAQVVRDRAKLINFPGKYYRGDFDGLFRRIEVLRELQKSESR